MTILAFAGSNRATGHSPRSPGPLFATARLVPIEAEGAQEGKGDGGHSGTMQQRQTLIRKLVKELGVMNRDEILPYVSCADAVSRHREIKWS
jgi:hypothetical protein